MLNIDRINNINNLLTLIKNYTNRDPIIRFEEQTEYVIRYGNGNERIIKLNQSNMSSYIFTYRKGSTDINIQFDDFDELTSFFKLYYFEINRILLIFDEHFDKISIVKSYGYNKSFKIMYENFNLFVLYSTVKEDQIYMNIGPSKLFDDFNTCFNNYCTSSDYYVGSIGSFSYGSDSYHIRDNYNNGYNTEYKNSLYNYKYIKKVHKLITLYVHDHTTDYLRDPEFINSMLILISYDYAYTNCHVNLIAYDDTGCKITMLLPKSQVRLYLLIGYGKFYGSEEYYIKNRLMSKYENVEQVIMVGFSANDLCILDNVLDHYKNNFSVTTTSNNRLTTMSMNNDVSTTERTIINLLYGPDINVRRAFVDVATEVQKFGHYLTYSYVMMELTCFFEYKNMAYKYDRVMEELLWIWNFKKYGQVICELKEINNCKELIKNKINYNKVVANIKEVMISNFNSDYNDTDTDNTNINTDNGRMSNTDNNHLYYIHETLKNLSDNQKKYLVPLYGNDTDKIKKYYETVKYPELYHCINYVIALSLEERIAILSSFGISRRYF